MKILAPAVITVALSWMLYGQKLLMTKGDYDAKATGFDPRMYTEESLVLYRQVRAQEARARELSFGQVFDPTKYNEAAYAQLKRNRPESFGS
jgi:hypothetical protein